MVNYKNKIHPAKTAEVPTKEKEIAQYLYNHRDWLTDIEKDSVLEKNATDKDNAELKEKLKQLQESQSTLS